MGFLAVATLAPATGRAQATAPGTAPAAACKPRSVVVVATDGQSREAAELRRMVQEALSRYGCYKTRDVVESLEAGMGEGLSQIETAKREAEAGQKLVLEMKLEPARGHFRAAVDAFSAGFAYLPYAGPFVDALMYLGVCEAGLNNGKGATEAFQGALRLRPDVALDDYSQDPDAQAWFGKAKQLNDAGATGALTVDTDPQRAEVWLDGKYLGIAPLDEPEVAAGPHWVMLRKPGYIRRTIAVQVPAGGSASVGAAEGRLAPARRQKLYETTIAKLARDPSGEGATGIEDVKALFLSDLAVVLHVQHGANGMTGRLTLWDLSTMQKLWTGVEPEEGAVSELGRGAAEALVSRGIAKDEERGRVQESGAATVKAKGGIVSKWWFWTTIGAVVVAGGATAAVLLTRPKSASRGFGHDGTGGVIVRF